MKDQRKTKAQLIEELTDLRTRLAALEESGGEARYRSVTVQDITERQYAHEELGKSHESLRNLATRLQPVREEERAVLAREVHEELGQALVGLKMDLAWLTGSLPVDQEPLQRRARAMASLIDSTLTTVRKIPTGLRPAMLDALGLEPAIEWQATAFEQRAEIRCEVHLDPGEIVPSQDRDTALFRIFQEALANVGRHAEASHVRVTLRSNAGELMLVVSDDGKGISPDQIASHKSLGLIGMRERAAALGGEVEIQPGPEGGTRVTMTVPLGVRLP